MNESSRDNCDAWHELGGNAPEALSIESRRAMASAGLGSKALASEIITIDSHEEYTRRHLSGVASRTPEQDESLKAFAQEARDAADARAIKNGADPILVAARRRARLEREQRGY